MTNTPTTTLDALQSEQSKVVKTKVIRLNDLIQFLQVKFSLSPDIRYPSLKDAYY